MDKKLTNPPIAECIFELRWKLEIKDNGTMVDPHYKLLLGRIFDKINSNYPYHEQLPSATIPDEFVPYIVQHRFRPEAGGWPLIQLGPGIVTLNDTKNYIWVNFEDRIIKLLDALYLTYPDNANLKFSSIHLQYINAIEVDFQSINIIDFIKRKMKIDINLPEKLFKDTGVRNFSSGINLDLVFGSTKPDGVINIQLARGTSNNVDALIWNIIIKSENGNNIDDKSKISLWIKEAHNISENWFLTLSEGELLRGFE